MTTSLIRGRYVVCGDPTRVGRVDVIEDAAVYQQDGMIAEVGRYVDLARHRVDAVIGGPDSVVLPGFVNAHHHIGLTPFQLGVPNLPLEMWIAARLGMREVDPYLDTLYSAFEMVSSGVTTVQHLHGHMFSPPERWPGEIDAILRAYRDIGMRVSFSSGIVEQDTLVLNQERFMATLPPGIRERLDALPRSERIPIEDQLAASFTDVVSRWGGNLDRLIRVQLAPQNLHWCSDRGLSTIKDVADSHGVGMHMHLLETLYQREYARRRTGGSAVAHLHDLGLLGPTLTLGHGVWLSEADIDLLAQTDTFVCHNPSSNLRLRSGVAPVNELLARGVRVALGIDEAGINDDRDMLQEMRVALNIHRLPGVESSIPTPSDILRMATEHGALTTGFGDRIGVIAPGKAADLVLMDWDAITAPYLASDVSVVDAVVHRGRSSGVQTVIVDGRPIFRDGAFTLIDRVAALSELARSLRVAPEPGQREREELSAALVPAVRDYLREWPVDAGEPFYRFNGRG